MVESGDQVSRMDLCRPVRGGLSEGLVEGSYTPTGMGGFLMRVNDPSGVDSSVTTTNQYTRGSLIRVSSNRPYTANDTVGLGENICQPASPDGGSIGQTVGQTCANVPLGTNPDVDVAVRTANEYNENPQVHNLNFDSAKVFGIQRNFGQMVGDDVYVYHRASGGFGIGILTVTEVPSAESTAGEAAITYPVDSGTTTETHTVQNQILTDTPTEITPQSSGSPVLTMDQRIVGLFVGISDANEGVITPIDTIESVLNAQTVTGLRLSGIKT